MHSLMSYELPFNGKNEPKIEMCALCVIGSTEIEVPMNSSTVSIRTRYLVLWPLFSME